MRNAECVLDRPQQAEVVGWDWVDDVAAYSLAERERRHVAAAADSRRPFVEHDEDDRPRDAQERRQQLREEPVGGRERAVVPVVAQVGRDEREGRQRARVQVAERVDVPRLPGEVQEGPVLLREAG